jgi:hypothetical protein
VDGPYQIDTVSFADENGKVTIFEEGAVPFSVKRAFLVEADANQIRGQHAHRRCTQFLVAIGGNIRVETINGNLKKVFHLSVDSPGLLLPSMTWATQYYEVPDSRLLVLCDQLFDELDYIRDYAQFIASQK